MVTKNLTKISIEPGDSVISYSQFSMYQSCPRSWELAYVQGLRTKEPSIHLLFGTSMHETIQGWLESVYSGDDVDAFDVGRHLYMSMDRTFAKMVTEWGVPFSSADEITEYYLDGIDIISQLKKSDLHDPTDTKLFGIEYEIVAIPVEFMPRVKLIGFIDIVLSMLDDTQFVIRDLKTSTKGWGEYQKSDITKLSQMMIYKYYFAQNHNIRPSNVTTQYIILSRKTLNKIEVFIPKQTPQFMNMIINDLKKFVIRSFNDDGSYKMDVEHPAISGYGYENCRFCEFKDRMDLCPVNRRIPDIKMKVN